MTVHIHARKQRGKEKKRAALRRSIESEVGTMGSMDAIDTQRTISGHCDTLRRK